VQCEGAAELHLDWDAHGRTDSWRDPDLSAVLIPYEDVCMAMLEKFRFCCHHSAGNRPMVPIYVLMCMYVCAQVLLNGPPVTDSALVLTVRIAESRWAFNSLVVTSEVLAVSVSTSDFVWAGPRGPWTWPCSWAPVPQ
jgi:hypothetical protein